MTSAIRVYAETVVQMLRDHGHEALFAGGCVRDLLLHREPADYDVATSAAPEAVMALFRRTIPVGASFGVVRVLGPKGVGEVEVATFRSDGAYLDGRRPESVTFGNARDDAQRRDFTINGMFLDPASGAVIDYVGGRDDLASGRIRAIGDPRARFAEDKLRLLRAVRFASRLGFAIEPETWAAIVAMAPQVTQVSVERITQEWRKVIVDPRRSWGVTSLRAAGLLAPIFPEVAAVADAASPSVVAPGSTVWDEVMRTLDALPTGPSFALAMASLLRPVGSPDAIQGIARRLKFSNEDRERIASLIAHELPSDDAPRSALKRFLALPEIDEVLTLRSAVAIAREGHDRRVRALRAYLRDEPDGPINPAPLATGRDLIAAGLRPGPNFARVLETIRDAQLDGAITTVGEAVAMALQIGGDRIE